MRDKEASSARITSLMRELDVKAQAEARFDMERKSWAERVERIEKIASDAKGMSLCVCVCVCVCCG